MTKYHINPKTGNPGACSAAPGACPFGGEANHYESASDARKAFESANTTAPALAKKPGVRLENRAAKHTPAATWSAFPETATDEELKNASAYAVVNNKFVAITVKDTRNPETDFTNLSDYDGADYLHVGTKSYLIGTPQGNFIKVSYTAAVDAQRDDSWEFSPEISASYAYYKTLVDLKANTPQDEVKHHTVDDESITREKGHNYERNAYDHYSSSSARSVAVRALNELPRPYDIARIASLKNSDVKLPKETILGDKYFRHANPEVRAATVARKEFPAEAQAEALKDSSFTVPIALAQRPDIQKEHIETLLAMDNRWTQSDNGDYGTPRYHLVKNEKLPLRLMNKLVKEGTVIDMRALHNNRGLPPKVREALEARAKGLALRLW